MPCTKTWKITKNKQRDLQLIYCRNITCNCSVVSTHSSDQVHTLLPFINILFSIAALVTFVIPYCDVEFFERVGIGAFGTVFRGRWKPMNKVVAIKECEERALMETALKEVCGAITFFAVQCHCVHVHMQHSEMLSHV